MNDELSPIYRKYLDALDAVSGRGVWLDTGAVRLAFRLALDEAHAHGLAQARAQGAGLAQAYSQELARLGEYLVAQHGHDADAVLDAAPAQVVDRVLGVLVNLAATASRVDSGAEIDHWLAANFDAAVPVGTTPVARALAALSFYHDLATAQQAALTTQRKSMEIMDKKLLGLEERLTARDIDLANERQLAALACAEVEILKAAQAAVPVPAALATPNGNGKTTPWLATPNAKATMPPGLSPVAEDYWQGCERGVHPFRKLPLEIRLEIAQVVLRSLAGDGNGNVTMTEYDALKPAWMPTASGLPKTFGCTWLDLPTLTPDRIKVAA